jgi:hypothetical protein
MRERTSNMKITFLGIIKYKSRSLLFIISVLLITLLLGSNLVRINQEIRKGLRIFKSERYLLTVNSEEKMRYKLGFKVLDYYEFIKRETPPDAKILIPPQGYPWPMTGNAAYSRYFLYPRYLISGKEKEAGIDLKKEKISYVLVIWGESNVLEYDFTHGWPKFSVPAKQIIYKKPGDEQFNYEKIILKEDFNPKDIKNDLWGLIEVDFNRL